MEKLPQMLLQEHLLFMKNMPQVITKRVAAQTKSQQAQESQHQQRQDTLSTVITQQQAVELKSSLLVESLCQVQAQQRSLQTAICMLNGQQTFIQSRLI